MTFSSQKKTENDITVDKHILNYLSQTVIKRILYLYKSVIRRVEVEGALSSKHRFCQVRKYTLSFQ
jgi:hypothetical protein